MWEFCGKAVFAQFWANCPKLCGNCNFPQNYCTRKLGEISVLRRGLVPSIPHEAGLYIPYDRMEERVQENIPSKYLVEIKLENNYSEYDSKVKQPPISMPITRDKKYKTKSMVEIYRRHLFYLD